jgi:hypothetical protein
MKIEMIKMSTCLESYLHIELPTKLELGIPHFSYYINDIHYYPQSIYYHLNLVKIEIHNMLEFELVDYLN